MDPKTITQLSNQAYEAIDQCKQSMVEELQWLIEETPSDRAGIQFGEALVLIQAAEKKILKGFVKHDAAVEIVVQKAEVTAASQNSGRRAVAGNNNRSDQYKSLQRPRTSKGTYAATR